MAACIIEFTDSHEETRYVKEYVDETVHDTDNIDWAQIFDDVTDATLISEICGAIETEKGTESVPHTIPPPRPH